MKRIAIFASGSGTNFQALAEACQSGEIDAEVVLMVSDRPSAKVNERAERLGIERWSHSIKEFADKAAWERQVMAVLEEKQVDLICLAGYMRILGDEIIDAYQGRMINIHPSLLPAFKGAHAIEDAFRYGVKVYGVTVHYVNKELDGGKIIAQRSFPYEGNDIEALEAMIHATEYPLYIDTVKRLCER
ncbi:MAG: phosphoribosylglycinamide formyltransferase [Rikenellaceae bacterium]|nr:phosphoribosylglycinamide formyltransferase [Rikenellaceae bacterium]